MIDIIYYLIAPELIFSGGRNDYLIIKIKTFTPFPASSIVIDINS